MAKKNNSREVKVDAVRYLLDPVYFIRKTAEMIKIALTIR